MPLTIPPFAAYQAPLFPVACAWSRTPPEGPRMIACEIDWGLTVAPGLAVQFSLASGPVEFSQIVAFSVDNGLNGSDASFIFPDTGKQLTIPAYAQGVYPAFTNALTFYVESSSAVSGDRTVFCILNTMPPPVSVLPSQEQSHAGTTGLSLSANATTPIIPAGVTGTIQGLNLVVTTNSTTAGQCSFQLIDGTSAQVWGQTISVPTGPFTQSIPVTGLRIRFINGLNAVVSLTSGITSGSISVNVYYSVP